MSRVTPELEELVDLFCEDCMSVEQAGRLESLVKESAEAGEYLRESFQVHCELAWEFGRDCGDALLPVPVDIDSFVSLSPLENKRRRTRLWAFSAVAVALLLIAGTLVLTNDFQNRHANPLPSANETYIARVGDVRWCDKEAPAPNSPLVAGSNLAIRQGLLEVRFDNGVRLIVQGPAELELQSPLSAALRSGSVTAEVPSAAHGFAIHTANCTVVDLGTRFGVASQSGRTDVEVFAGNVVLRLDGLPEGRQEQRLAANSAMRITGEPGKNTVRAEAIAAGNRHFVQSIAGSAAMLQARAESDPRLVHYYPFEGATDQERLRDRRGNLDLAEVMMRDGDGGGRLAFTTGPDPTTQVAVPFRAELFGSDHGRGLQSKSVFQPSPAMSIELLLQYSGSSNSHEGFLASAVSTRHDRDQCGFLVAALGGGELACLLDGGSEWLRSGFKFVPGRWYYVAATFDVKGTDVKGTDVKGTDVKGTDVKDTETEINAYVAALGDTNPALQWVLQNQSVRGVPASGLLGIGKGFDGEMASAYPWNGALGLIAVYDALLERSTIEDHLQALKSQGNGQPGQKPIK
jgi:hypothetical protein